MKIKGKKLILSLAATILLSTASGHAQALRYKTNLYYSSPGYGYKTVYNKINNYYSNYYSDYYSNYYSNSKNNKVEELPSYNKTPINNGGSSQEGSSKENNSVNNNVQVSSSIEGEVVRLVNVERQKAGLAPLVHSSELSKVANAKSQDMASNNYFSHNSPTYGDPFAMMRSFNIQYKTAGENIAKGYSSAEAVVKGWMNSSGHRENILNPSFGKIGVGYVNSKGTGYWTQMFTN